MIVCHCHALTDRDIRAAAREGARSCDEIKRVCHAGGECGGCVPRIQMILQGECRTYDENPSRAVAS